MGNKIKFGFGILACALLSSCNDPRVEAEVQTFPLPEVMKQANCQMYESFSKSGASIYLVYCPHANTSTISTGKNSVHNTVITEQTTTDPSNSDVEKEKEKENTIPEPKISPNVKKEHLEPRPMTPEEYSEYYKRTYVH